MSEYKNGGDNNMLWEQGSQVRILVPRHKKPRSYRNVTPFLLPTYLKYLHGFLGVIQTLIVIFKIYKKIYNGMAV